jgi:hypothetical protein
MAENPDWLLKNHTALHRQAGQTITYLGEPANRTRMGFGADTPQGHWFDTEFVNAFIPYDAAYIRWADAPNRTPLVTTAFFEAEAAFKPVYRKLYNGFLRENPLVTDEDRQGMGLPKRSSGRRHSVSAPATIPSASVILPSPAVVEIHFRDAGSDHKAKPAGVHGVEIIWAILGNPPENWEELAHSSFNTHSPLVLTFERDQRGKALYFAMRWEDNHGGKGRWSDIQSTVIP